MTISGLTGCGTWIKSDYQRPPVNIPSQWSAMVSVADDSEKDSQQPWWYAFNDPNLNHLIDKALRKNNNLALATLKVQQARLQADLTNTNLTPEVNISGSASVSKNVQTAGSSHSYNTNIGVSYALDVWGKFARIRDIALWEVQATEWDKKSIALELIAATARLYWQIAYLNQSILTTQQSIAYTQEVLDLIKLRYVAGADSRLDEILAEGNLANQKITLTTLIQEREKAHNSLAILFDQAPNIREIERPNLTEQLPTIPVDLPVEILSRRPDLQAAELRLRKSLAKVDVTKASFYPALNLTGSIGTASTALTDLLKNPLGVLGLNLALPFVQWNTQQLNIKITQVEYEQAVIQFRQTLYNALAEVENALTTYMRYQETALQRKHLLEQALHSEKILAVRYRAGQISAKDWLAQQETRRLAALNVAENHYQQLSQLMHLYQVLGGDTAHY